MLSVKNCIVVPTLKGFTDAFRPTVSKPESRAYLFNPQNARYQWKDSRLMRDGTVLSFDELRRLAGDVAVNQPIDDNVLIYGVLSYLVFKGLNLYSTFKIGITDISRFFGVTMGKTGFQLFDKLQALQTVYGVREDSHQVFPLMTVERIGKKLSVSSQYMHSVWTVMLATSAKAENRTPYYFTGLAHADLARERDKVAALIVIELVRLIVTKGRRIRLYTLEQYVPQLRTIRESTQPNNVKNRDLKRIFGRVYQLLRSKTELSRTFVEFSTNELIPKVEQFHESITVHHQGYRESEWR